MADAEYHRKWREANREKVREASRKHEAKRKERRAEEIKERRLNDPEFRERERARRERFKLAHPDRVLESGRKNEARPERKIYKQNLHKEHKDADNARVRENYYNNIEHEHERSKEKAQRYLASGWCHNCKTPRMPNSNTECEKHWFSARAMQRLGRGGDVIARGQELKKILEKQEYRCAYTGRLLVPGINASVDHIRPQSKHPDLANSISNIQWVDININHMKTDMDHEEFLETCALIAERAGLVKRV